MGSLRANSCSLISVRRGRTIVPGCWKYPANPRRSSNCGRAVLMAKPTVFFSILYCIVLLQSAALAGLNFSKPRKFAVSPLPDAIAVGDFNHDGKLDLAVS